MSTGFHQRRLQERLKDPEFRREYEAARQEIEQVDELIRRLDALRAERGLSKAELARRIGKNPAAVRRLFTAQSNPELRTVAAIAGALGVRVGIIRPSNRRGEVATGLPQA